MRQSFFHFHVVDSVSCCAIREFSVEILLDNWLISRKWPSHILPNNHLPRINRNDNRKDPVGRDLSNANENRDASIDDSNGISAAVLLASGNVSMGAIFAQVQASFDKLSSAAKDMANQMAQGAVKMRNEVFKQQQEAAQKEKSIATKKAFIGAGIAVGGAAVFGALDSAGNTIAKREKELIDLGKLKGNSWKPKALEATSAAVKGVTGQSSTNITEAIMSSQELAVKQKRNAADFNKETENQIKRQEERFEAEYQDARRKIIEMAQTWVNLQNQQQQSVAWRA